MSNVRIEAIGDVGIEVEVLLGVTSRGKHLVNSGDSIDLTVGGNQRLVTKESTKAAATAKANIPVGADVTDQPSLAEPDPAEDNLVLLGQNFVGEADAKENPENGEAGLFGDFVSDSALDALGNDKAPEQGDLFDDPKTEG